MTVPRIAIITFSLCTLISVTIILLVYVRSLREFASFTMTSSLKILCYGDSLTAGFHAWGRAFLPYGQVLKQRLGPGCQVDWLGYNGWTTAQMVASVDDQEARDVTRHIWPGLNVMLNKTQYDLAIVMAGTNDLGHSEPPEVIVSNLKKLYDMFRAGGTRRVLAIGIPESAYVMHNHDAMERRNKVNTELKRLANSTGEDGFFLDYVDCPVTYSQEAFERDGLHFNRGSYQFLGERLAQLIRDNYSNA